MCSLHFTEVCSYDTQNTLFPIKLAIFSFPSKDLQNLRFPTTLARLGKVYCAARLRCIL